MFNECCITIVTWQLMFFTEFIPDMAMQSTMGWSMIICIMLCTIVNLGICFWFIGKTFQLIYRKIRNRFMFAIYGEEPTPFKNEKEKKKKKKKEIFNDEISLVSLNNSNQIDSEPAQPP